MKDTIKLTLVGIVLITTGILIGVPIGRSDTAESLRIKAKTAFYDASAEYSACKRRMCGDCGPEPVWQNGE